MESLHADVMMFADDYYNIWQDQVDAYTRDMKRAYDEQLEEDLAEMAEAPKDDGGAQ